MKSKKGFTLVEIIISIAIGSIVLMIAGSMLVSSFKFLFSTTDTDLDKRAVDSLIDVVRSDVEYSYDVRLVKANSDMAINDLTIENGWHSYYVQDNVLYRDNEELLDQSYYNKKNFELYANGNYENGVRVDFKYVLKNNNENAYSARDTIMFLNVTTDKKILDIGLYVGGEVPLTGEDDGYRLYFTDKYNKNIPNKPNKDDVTGTVEDYLKCLSLSNNRWEFVSGVKYHYGDLVYYNNSWWMYINPDSNGVVGAPGESSSFWTKCSAEWVPNSYYETGDIVIYNNQYYRRKSNQPNNTNPEELVNNNVSNAYWERITKETALEEGNYFRKNDVYDTQSKDTIINKLDGIDLEKIPVYDKNLNNQYPVLGSQKPSQPSDFVKVPFVTIQGTFYKYYYRVFNNNATPGERTSDGFFGWQEIKVDFDENSAYLKDDIIYARRNGENKTYRYKTKFDILTNDTISNLKNNINGYDEGVLYTQYLNPSSYSNSNRDQYTKIVWELLN